MNKIYSRQTQQSGTSSTKISIKPVHCAGPM